MPWAVGALCLVQFVDVLGVTVVVTSLPAMLASLHASQSYSSLIRCLQGAAAAASVPSALKLLTSVTPEGAPRRRAIAAWSAAGAAAGASGFVIGGIVTDLTSWRFVFWAYIPLVIVLGAVIRLSVPPETGSQPVTSLNLAGSSTFTAAVMAFVVGCTIVTQVDDRAAGILLLGACVVFAVAAGLAMIAAADIALIPSARSAWAVPLCAAGAGTGIGLSSVAATGLGTDVEVRWRGGASGIINTAAQLGTAARPGSVAAPGRAEHAVTASQSLGLAAGPARVPHTEDPR